MLDMIPGHEKIWFKQRFIERYSSLTDFEKFKQYSLCYLRKSIRVNTLKISIAELKKRLEMDWELKQIPWCKEGFWIKGKRTDIGNLIEHSLGYVYVQEAASMIPPVVLNPKPGEAVLDMCAAPGSKTTQIAQSMKNKGVLVANDLTKQRLNILMINLQMLGVTNAIVTMMHGRFFKTIKFDKILVDAPCSGTGTIRKSLKTLVMWNPKMIRRLAAMQKQLLETACLSLKNKGTLVYSTCSLEPEENEGVIDYLINKYDDIKLQKIELKIESGKPVVEFEDNKYSQEIKKCLRIWPQDNNTDGFFVAKLKKV